MRDSYSDCLPLMSLEPKRHSLVRIPMKHTGQTSTALKNHILHIHIHIRWGLLESWRVEQIKENPMNIAHKLTSTSKYQ